jgi:hypothetical protein
MPLGGSIRSPVRRVTFARPLFLGVTALAALVVLTGCGGSSVSSTPGATSTTVAAGGPLCDPVPCQITRAEFAAKLDYLCLRGMPALMGADTSFEHATKASDYTKAAAAMESALLEFPPYQNAMLGLEPAPAHYRAAYTRYVDLTRRIHGLSERIIAAGRAHGSAEVVRLSQLVQEDLATRTRVAGHLGTKHCER